MFEVRGRIKFSLALLVCGGYREFLEIQHATNITFKNKDVRTNIHKHSTCLQLEGAECFLSCNFIPS